MPKPRGSGGCSCDRMKPTSCSAYWKASLARSCSRQGAREVAAQRQDVLDARLRVAVEDRRQLLPRVADTRQVGDRRQEGLALDPDDQVVGPLAGRAPGAVRHRDEGGPQGLELRDGQEELVRGPVRLGREELEAEGRGPALEDVSDMHDRRPGHPANRTIASRIPGNQDTPPSGGAGDHQSDREASRRRTVLPHAPVRRLGGGRRADRRPRSWGRARRASRSRSGGGGPGRPDAHAG